MPRGKKNTIPTTSSTTNEITTSSNLVDKTDLKSFLFRIRDICRNKGAQMDENGNIYADLIYDDLLFLKDVWHLADSDILNINKDAIINGFPITDIKLDTIASLKNGDQAHVGDVFKRLWTQLQRSNLKDIFDRDFALSNMLKDEKLKVRYLPLLTALLEYVGGVTLQDHEDTDPYEYFTQDLKKSKSKYFGQFYTPESITKACVEEIRPKFGEIGLDPSGGTGKFMRTAATYIHHHEPEHSEWDAFQHMRTVEIESKIYRQGILGTFIKYKKLPNMAYLRKGNSFGILPSEAEQFDYILANPPYGGTVDGFDELYYDTEMVQKGKRMSKNTIVKPTIIYPFQFVKKDTCVLFLQLIVNKLKNGGRAAVVFNGTIMNDSHRDVMKWFLENCDLRKIIVNPSGTFKCTGIETYTFIFWKGVPTNKIEYFEVGSGKKLGEFTHTELETRGWDINPVFKEESKVQTVFGSIKISELISFTLGNLQATKAVPGEYKLLTLEDTATHNKSCLDGEVVALCKIPSGTGDGFRPKIRYYNGKCHCTSLMYVCEFKSDILSKKFFWYFWHLNNRLLKRFYKGTANKSLDKDRFLDYNLPFPPREIQDQIVATLDRIFAPGTTDLADTLKLTDRAMELVLKDPTGGLLEQVVEFIKYARDTTAQVERLKVHMISLMKSVGSLGFEFKSLLELCDFTNGETLSSSEKIEDGEFDVMGGGMNYVGKTTLFNREGENISISKSGASAGFVKYHDRKYWAGDCFTIISRNNNVILTKFLYHYLKSNNDLIMKRSTGSTIPHCKWNDINTFVVPVPPIDFQQSLIERLNKLESQLTALENLSKQSEDNARFILDSYLTATPTTAPEN